MQNTFTTFRNELKEENIDLNSEYLNSFNLGNEKDIDKKFADGGTTDDFDYMSLFNTSAEDEEKINQQIKKSKEQEKEDWYQGTKFSKKWASTYQDAVNRTVKDYLDAKATYEDWGSRQYKSN